jgi:prephenate dehydratase
MSREFLAPDESLPKRLYTLGPEGTFSDQAARTVREHLSGTGREALGHTTPPISYTRTLPEVLAKAEADGESLGVVPIENSDAGTVIPVQEGLVKHRLTILAEYGLRVRFSLLANRPPAQVQTLLSQPVAYDQCTEFVTHHLPEAQITFTNSNIESLHRFLAAHAAGEAVAAVVPWEAGQAHTEHLLHADIQNFANNTTRFVVVRQRREREVFDYARHKASVYVEPVEDRPGLLYALLSVFNTYALNLCRLESRPDKVTPWKYVFFIDFNNGPGSPQCVQDLVKTGHRITVLGSYDALE